MIIINFPSGSTEGLAPYYVNDFSSYTDAHIEQSLWSIAGEAFHLYRCCAQVLEQMGVASFGGFQTFIDDALAPQKLPTEAQKKQIRTGFSKLNSLAADLKNFDHGCEISAPFPKTDFVEEAFEAFRASTALCMAVFRALEKAYGSEFYMHMDDKKFKALGTISMQPWSLLADNYFSPKELLAAIEAVASRCNNQFEAACRNLISGLIYGAQSASGDYAQNKFQQNIMVLRRVAARSARQTDKQKLEFWAQRLKDDMQKRTSQAALKPSVARPFSAVRAALMKKRGRVA